MVDITLDPNYPRDLKGYGAHPPKANWPGGAKIAVQFVLNYEEGSENCILHGDKASEAFLSEIVGADMREATRHMSMESMYEYGSRVGVWRILNLFKQQEIPLTIFAVAMALERHPEACDAFLKAGHEICSHGHRWIDYQYVPEEIEREHMYQAIDIIKRMTGERPKGWYTGRTGPNSRRIIMEEGGFMYDADDYNDDLPWWTARPDGEAHLVIPYTLDNNDMKFSSAGGFNSGDQYFAYLRDAFDTLYEEGAGSEENEGTPRMMSIGLHCRLVGRPGRFQALKRFVEYVRGHEDVWFCRREEIAKHWHENHHPKNV